MSDEPDELELDLPDDDDELELELDEGATRGRGPGRAPSQEGDRRRTEPLEVEGSPRHRSRHHPEAAGWHHFITALLVALVLGLGWYGVRAFRAGSIEFELPPSTPHLWRSVRAQGAASARRRVEVALEVYEVMEQGYPVDLKLLVDRGLLPPGGVSYPWGGGSIEYQRQNHAFELGEPPFQP